MDSRLDEQQRGITMKSSAIALKHKIGEFGPSGKQRQVLVLTAGGRILKRFADFELVCGFAHNLKKMGMKMFLKAFLKYVATYS